MGAHAKHLRNLYIYIYFWRWASRKVFEPFDGQAEGGGHGIVAFISAAGFISGPAFERMRLDLRQRCHEIWVIDCTPEGHLPEVSSRIFQGVQQPVCIVLAARHMSADKAEPAVVSIPSRGRSVCLWRFRGSTDARVGDCARCRVAAVTLAAPGRGTNGPKAGPVPPDLARRPARRPAH